MPSRRATLERLLRRHGRTTAEEVGIDLRGGGADAAFQLLVTALLASTRISARIAAAAARELFAAGMTSAQRMCDATWQQRVDALGAGGYVRYDESTATYLGETAAWLLDRYEGDLDQLRDEAGREPSRERTLLKGAKGVGDVGVDIAFRELQPVWAELRPFVDERSLGVAADLELPDDAAGLAELHGDDDLSVVAAALVRVRLAKDVEVVRDGLDAPPTRVELTRATKPELLEHARRLGVAGRSSMRKDELVEALRRAG
jgi:endonuclease III